MDQPHQNHFSLSTILRSSLTGPLLGRSALPAAPRSDASLNLSWFKSREEHEGSQPVMHARRAIKPAFRLARVAKQFTKLAQKSGGNVRLPTTAADFRTIQDGLPSRPFADIRTGVLHRLNG